MASRDTGFGSMWDQFASHTRVPAGPVTQPTPSQQAYPTLQPANNYNGGLNFQQAGPALQPANNYYSGFNPQEVYPAPQPANNEYSGLNFQQNEQACCAVPAQQNLDVDFSDLPDLDLPSFMNWDDAVLQDQQNVLENPPMDPWKVNHFRRQEDRTIAPWQLHSSGFDVPEESPVEDRLATALYDHGNTNTHSPLNEGTAIHDGHNGPLAQVPFPFPTFPDILVAPNTTDAPISSVAAPQKKRGSAKEQPEAPLVPSTHGLVQDRFMARQTIEWCVQQGTVTSQRLKIGLERLQLVRAGNIFVFPKADIKRWSDGVNWGPSRTSNGKPTAKDSLAITMYKEQLYRNELKDNLPVYRENGLVKYVSEHKVGDTEYGLVCYFRPDCPVGLAPPPSPKRRHEELDSDDEEDEDKAAKRARREIFRIRKETEEQEKQAARADGQDGPVYTNETRKGMAKGYKAEMYRPPCNQECGINLRRLTDIVCPNGHCQ